MNLEIPVAVTVNRLLKKKEIAALLGVSPRTIDAAVLKIKVRKGEFAPAGVTDQPLLVIGHTDPLHVRVDVDETDARRI